MSLTPFAKVNIIQALQNFESAENNEETAAAVKAIAHQIQDGNLVGVRQPDNETISVILYLKGRP